MGIWSMRLKLDASSFLLFISLSTGMHWLIVPCLIETLDSST